MRYFEDIVIGTRRELGSYTFTAERIKAFASKYDPQAVSPRRGGWPQVAVRRACRVGLAHRVGLDARCDRQWLAPRGGGGG